MNSGAGAPARLERACLRWQRLVTRLLPQGLQQCVQALLELRQARVLRVELDQPALEFAGRALDALQRLAAPLATDAALVKIDLPLFDDAVPVEEMEQRQA